MRFQPGQQVVCVREGSSIWMMVDIDEKLFSGLGPSYRQIVTVLAYSHIHKYCIMLVEYPQIPSGFDYPNCYPEKLFEPLHDIKELEAILNTETIEK